MLLWLPGSGEISLKTTIILSARGAMTFFLEWGINLQPLCFEKECPADTLILLVLDCVHGAGNT